MYWPWYLSVAAAISFPFGLTLTDRTICSSDTADTYEVRSHLLSSTFSLALILSTIKLIIYTEPSAAPQIKFT